MTWKLRRSLDESTLTVVFEGKLDVTSGAASAAAFADELRRRPARVVWDLRKMTGYEPGARVAWQRALWPVRRRITQLDVVGGNALVRVGAVTLSMTLGLEASFGEPAAEQTRRAA